MDKREDETKHVNEIEIEEIIYEEQVKLTRRCGTNNQAGFGE